jgi:site-specific DNA recombinase
LFDAVQRKLDQQRINHNETRHHSGAPLAGRIFDENGNRMTPTYAVKNGIRYRYYLSRPLIQGQPDKAAKLNRVPAVEIEKLVIDAVRAHLDIKPQNSAAEAGPNSLSGEQELVATYVTRVDVRQDHLAVQLSARPRDQGKAIDQRAGLNHNTTRYPGQPGARHKDSYLLRIPWKKAPSKKPRKLIAPATSSRRRDPRPIRAETRAKLVTAIARGRH